MAFFGKGQTLVEDAMVAERPRHPSAPAKLKPYVDCMTMNEESLAEYREVAAAVGISDTDLLVEEFKLFLAKHDIPTFSLAEVTSYMDELTERTNPTKLGWHWCPVRDRDANVPLRFGRPSHVEQTRGNNGFSDGEKIVTAGSDYYSSHRFQEWQQHQTWHQQSMQQPERNNTQHYPIPEPVDWRRMPSPAYTRTIPLHALKKIALIEREFGAGKAIFLVTDYTVEPHIIVNPDPFLMAVIPNFALAHGKGRFIIDVWDEPGFGIERMVK